MGTITEIQPDKGWFRIEAKAADDGGETSAEVYIYAEIGDSYWREAVSAREFARQLAELDVDKINLFVNSPGGSAWDGVAIMNALRRHRARVEVTVDGIAASAASLICMAGDHITMNASSQMMIHDASGMAWGNAQTMHETAALLDKLSDSYADAYAKRAGGSREQWRATMRAETWYTAEEAVLAGLADEWDGSKESAAAANFDMSRFRFAGRDAAPAPRLPAAHAEVNLPGVGAAAWLEKNLSPRAAAPEPPVSPEPGHTNQKEIAMSDNLKAGLRERLGITDADTSEDGLLAALDEALSEQAETPEPQAALPDGVTMIETDVLAELRESAAEVKAIREEQAAERRAALVEAAISEGKIAPARRAHWLAQLNADEEGATAVLATLATGTIPLGEKGHSDEAMSSDEALYSRFYGEEA